MIKRNIGKRIKAYRTECNLSQSQLGELIGVNNRTISSWETDRTEPDEDDIARMASIFKCTTYELIDSVEIGLSFDELQIIGKWRDADDLTKDMVRRILGVI